MHDGSSSKVQIEAQKKVHLDSTVVWDSGFPLWMSDSATKAESLVAVYMLVLQKIIIKNLQLKCFAFNPVDFREPLRSSLAQHKIFPVKLTKLRFPWRLSRLARPQDRKSNNIPRSNEYSEPEIAAKETNTGVPLRCSAPQVACSPVYISP